MFIAVMRKTRLCEGHINAAIPLVQIFEFIFFEVKGGETKTGKRRRRKKKKLKPGGN